MLLAAPASNGGKMNIEEIIEIMSESEGRHIECIETDGEKWSGVVDVYESAFDNEDDETKGDSVCVRRDDGLNVLVYADEIETISISEN